MAYRILYDDGVKLPQDEATSATAAQSSYSGQIKLPPQVLLFLAALKDAAVKSNIEASISSIYIFLGGLNYLTGRD